MFAPKVEERARFEEIEDKPELKAELGLSNPASYVKYFDENYGHVALPTIQNWLNRRRKDTKRAYTKPVDADRDFDDFLDMCKDAGKKNSRYADLYAQLKGWKQKPKEETGDGISTIDRIKTATEIRDYFRQQYENTGMCEVCNQRKVLCN